MVFALVLSVSLTLVLLFRAIDRRPENEKHRRFDQATTVMVKGIAPKHKTDHITVGIFFVLGTLLVLVDTAANLFPAVHEFAEGMPGFSVAVSIAVLVDWIIDF